MPEHVDVVAVVDDVDDVRQLETAGEHRNASEQVLFVVGQEVVRPLDRVTERELTLGGLGRTLQQPEAVGEAIPDLGALIAAIRAAASSMPSGRPSSVSQISVTAKAVAGSRRPKSGRTARARSTKRVT